MATLVHDVKKLNTVYATLTLEKIESCIETDGGKLFRKYLKECINEADDAYRQDEEGNRSHLGASQIGKDCNRELWYGFRWAAKRPIVPRMRRLLNRGHLEEARFIALLKMIGCTVYTKDQNGKQFLVSYLGGHYGGSCDSVVVGIPDVPKGVPVLAEMKTHKDSSYIALKKEGLRASKFEHYNQMQTYMHGLDLQYGLYLAVNKDDDDLYGEIIPANPELQVASLEKARKIILATLPPPKITNNSSFWKCKFCAAYRICHKLPDETTKQIPIPAMNCRTCKFSKSYLDGKWRCSNPDNMKDAETYEPIELPKTIQQLGCQRYSVIKEM